MNKGNEKIETQSAGFTLLEVMVALAVAAIGLGAVSKSMTSNVDVAVKLKNRTIATWVASNRMAELRMERQFVGSGGNTERTEMGGVEWRVEDNYTLSADPNITKVEIRVFVDEEENPSGKLDGYIARYLPAQSEN